MAKDWIQRRNAEFCSQARVFSETIAADAAAYGIDPADAAALSAEYADFAAKYQAAAQPDTRTSSAVVARDDARKILARHMREMGARIRANPAVTSVMRIALTVAVPGSGERAPDGPPKTPPRVRVLSL